MLSVVGYAVFIRMPLLDQACIAAFHPFFSSEPAPCYNEILPDGLWKASGPFNEPGRSGHGFHRAGEAGACSVDDKRSLLIKRPLFPDSSRDTHCRP